MSSASIPQLIFIPARTRETHVFGYMNEADALDLVEFILFNSANPLTSLEFIEHNYANESYLKLDLIRALQSRIRKLEQKAHLVNKEILFAFEHLNKTNLQLNNNNNEIDTINLNNFQIDNKNFHARVNIYERIYLKNIHDSLDKQLNRYLHQINLLKQFENKILK